METKNVDAIIVYINLSDATACTDRIDSMIDLFRATQ